MSIVQTLTSSFKTEVLLGVHDFHISGGDTFKIALYSSSASLNANTTSYTTSGEITGTGYTAGGKQVSSLGVVTYNTSSSAGGGYVDFDDVTWSSAVITARGALIYNSTPSATDDDGNTLTNPAVAVLDFGSDKTCTGSNFTITFPSPSSSTAVVRIS